MTGVGVLRDLSVVREDVLLDSSLKVSRHRIQVTKVAPMRGTSPPFFLTVVRYMVRTLLLLLIYYH